MPTSITDEVNKYPETCLDLATDASAFRMFLQDPVYQSCVCDVDFTLGMKYLAQISLNDFNSTFEQCLPQFKTMDVLGSNPMIYQFPGNIGFASGLMLRYVSVMLDLVSFFGPLHLFNIAEIGGGFGGQAKIISDLYSVSSYTIVDLPEVLALQSQFLRHFPRIQSRIILLAARSEDIASEGLLSGSSLDSDAHIPAAGYDLCLSNYAFTELALEPRER